MSAVILREELPHVRAHCKDGSCWFIAPDERASLEAAWTLGKSFWWGVDAYDSRVLIKLADITGLSVWGEARIALHEAERDERKAREMTEG